jgi:hypothetical protein
MTDDLLQNPNDTFSVEPPELGPSFRRMLVSGLAKRLAAGNPKARWTSANESELHENVAKLVAEAKKRGLTSFRMTVTRPNGQRAVRDMDVETISREPSLQ